MAVYLSPPCRNLYCTLSALIKDHSVVLTRSAPFLSLAFALILTKAHTQMDREICEYKGRTLTGY